MGTTNAGVNIIPYSAGTQIDTVPFCHTITAHKYQSRVVSKTELIAFSKAAQLAH
jgi:hypothetical protein